MAEQIRLALVVSETYPEITGAMTAKACEHAQALGAIVTYICKVPGSYDAPFMVRKLIERDDVDAIATLGAVIEGETEHDEIVAHQAARKCADLSVQFGKPVTLGISGPGMTRLHAQNRIDRFARSAVESAIKLVRRARLLDSSAGSYPIVIDAGE